MDVSRRRRAPAGRAVAALALAGAALLAGGGASPAAAGVNDFHYDAWEVDYRLSADAEGRAQAQVTETISPHFPDTDVNRGINRGIVIDYLGASTDPRGFSVTTESGDPVPFMVRDEGEVRIVVIGNNRYVRGLQTYVLRYTLSDVILARDDGKADEFYWDLMDVERGPDRAPRGHGGHAPRGRPADITWP